MAVNMSRLPSNTLSILIWQRSEDFDNFVSFYPISCHNLFGISKILMSTTFFVKTYFEKSEEENEKMKMEIFNFFIIYVVWIKVVSVDSSNFDHSKYTNYFR